MNETSGSMWGGASIIGHSMIDFDKKKVRKALRKAGADVRKEARRLVSRRAVSAPGEMPGWDSGDLRKSIRIAKVGRRGGYVKVEPVRTPHMKAINMFYPAILYYGSEKNNIEPRKNYMIAALDTKRSEIQRDIKTALETSLVPR